MGLLLEVFRPSVVGSSAVRPMARSSRTDVVREFKFKTFPIALQALTPKIKLFMTQKKLLFQMLSFSTIGNSKFSFRICSFTHRIYENEVELSNVTWVNVTWLGFCNTPIHENYLNSDEQSDGTLKSRLFFKAVSFKDSA